MFKKIMLSLLPIFATCQAEDIKFDFETTHYLFMGTKTPSISSLGALSGLTLGIGCRNQMGEHIMDSRASYFVHPAIQLAQAEISYLYANKHLKGVYAGVGLAYGTVLVQDLHTHAGNQIELSYYRNTLVQFPLTLGWKYEDSSGRWQFIQLQYTLDKFLSVEHGIEF